MATKKPAENSHHRREKKPPLTHFLCIPLVNSVSLPQLEHSIETFRAGIPWSRPRPDTQGANKDWSRKPLIPGTAVRPIGTLHLTLGVMSLTTEERLNEALEFFQSLDLVDMMHEAEKKANRKANSPATPAISSEEITSSDDTQPQPFNISLESLHALPRASAATVLHAGPVDPTSRLYPFCEMLRDKFLEAGYLVGEYKGGKEPQQELMTNSDSIQKVAGGATDDPTDLDRMFEQAIDEIPDLRSHKQKPKKQKPRPLLLHATIVNTIYKRGRPTERPKHGEKKERYQFDAREIIARYRDYYVDGRRTVPRADFTSTGIQLDPFRDLYDPRAKAELSNKTLEGSPSERQYATSDEKHPFVWAKDIPLESISICEMGAKQLDLENHSNEWINARMGAEYKPIASRSLNFGSSNEPIPAQEIESQSLPVRNVAEASEEDDEGGVRVRYVFTEPPAEETKPVEKRVPIRYVRR